MKHFSSPARLCMLVVAPALAVCLLSYAALHLQNRLQLERQARAYGDAVTLPLANLFAEHVLQEDILSLTVLASQMQAGTPIATVEIYDVNRRLLAQAGERPGAYSFSRLLSYRKAAVGHLTISLDAPAGGFTWLALLPLLLVGALAAGVWLQRGRVFGWMTDKGLLGKGRGQPEADAPEAGQPCLLACRIWPADQARRYQALFIEALRLSHGRPEASGRELTASFHSPQQAADAALLLRCLVAETGARLSCGAALGKLQPDAEPAARRRLTHIASLAEGHIVADREVATSLASKGLLLQNFQHPMMDTDQLVQLTEASRRQDREALARALLESHSH